MLRLHSILENNGFNRFKQLISVLLIGVVVSACSPTVKVQAPDKPIVINLNVKIEQEVRIRVEKGVEDLLTENPDIF
ncbi:MAG: YnbE family lipoprotein [Rhodospirillaceae bacterium]